MLQTRVLQMWRALCLLCVLAAAAARDTDEATCPPARFIACGNEPAPNTCLSYVVAATGERQCCWVVDADGAAMHDAWVTVFVLDDDDGLQFGPLEFGAQDDGAVMEAEFELASRVMTALWCHYYVTDRCAPGDGDVGRVLTVRATDPTRFRVTEAVARHTARETTANPAEHVCACEHRDALPLPERYRCCYWGSDFPPDEPEPTLLRTTTCYAPRAGPSDATDCRRITRPVAACGDVGSCFCRFEYSDLAPGATRDPWACGQCCPRLTDDFGRDQLAKNNNTRTQCLSDIFPFTPAPDGACTHELLGPREPAETTSGAGRRSAFWW